MDDNRKFGILAGVSMLAFSMGMGPAWAQETAEAAPEVSEQRTLDTIVVTGFRQSLAEALEQKRRSTGSVDAILAEDIADFPDQNLAESLQRIPGVTISRENGEGRGITVRGLGGNFTRVRINGMETIAGTSGDSTNTGRGFDFNIFASELFNQIVVHKTASAKLDEGSLGAVVDLSTGHPLDYKEGLTAVASATAQYNENTEDTKPRLAGLLSWHDPSGVWGVSASLAFSESKNLREGQNTVRWQRAQFAEVLGTDCVANPTDAACAEVAGAFHPRIPRYGVTETSAERTGLTTSFQYQPNDSIKFTLDGLFAQLDSNRKEKWGEVLFRGNEDDMNVSSYTYDAASNNLTAMTVDNAFIRMENFDKSWTTDFYQIGARLEHDFTDRLRGDLLIGQSANELDIGNETTFMYDNRTYQNFSYDYTDDKYPTITFGGADVLDPATFTATDIRDRPSAVNYGFTTASYDLEFDINDSYTLEGGLDYKKFDFDRTEARRDTTACALIDCAAGQIGVAPTAELSEVFTFGGEQGAGSTTSWLIPNVAGWADYWNLTSLPATPREGSINEVEEESLAAYVQFNGDVDVGDMGLRFDLGVRYQQTDQTSSGFNSGTYVTVERETYDDVLPSMNVALDVTDDLILRVAAAKVLTRPSLGNVSPGGSVDSFNYGVSFQNPNITPTRATNFDVAAEWYFAEDSLLSLAVFHKEIDSFPVRDSITGTYASTGLPLSLLQPTSPAEADPEGQLWNIAGLVDGEGATITGAEFSFQLPFSNFSTAPVISNMGFVGNYTYVDSEVDHEDDGVNGPEIISEKFFGMSNTSYNATLYYENDRLSARVAAAYRDEYITGNSGNSNQLEGYGDRLTVDFSSSFAVTDNLSLSFEGLNLTDEYTDRWTDLYSRRRYEYQHTGRVFMLGAKYDF